MWHCVKTDHYANFYMVRVYDMRLRRTINKKTGLCQTWVLEVGGGDGLLDLIAQQIECQVGRLQLQRGDQQVQDGDLGLMPDPGHLLLRVRFYVVRQNDLGFSVAQGTIK